MISIGASIFTVEKYNEQSTMSKAQWEKFLPLIDTGENQDYNKTYDANQMI